MKGRLEYLTTEYLSKVLSWRNSDRIRKNMYNEKIITMEEHQNWFEKIRQSEKDHYLLYFFNETPVGLVCFNDITRQHAHCRWGFYIGEENTEVGTGTLMALLAFDHAFYTLQLNKIYGEVLDYNLPSRKYHEKLGFKEEGYFRSHVRKGENFYDVFSYGLFKKDWYELHRPFILKGLSDKGIKLN
ncbi:UDP-4-amino-4,6-dideoxy-N-acetyl-beta-L-altrosamine N-acetyltransferase [Virgibacillus ihumii]|uniref:UDP-4-amino-4, 6-dideoxy-N-acetyl-beta-L-altrosamine N-acetyltransferase n=1 Tax=Virgibacillus ihumii TaxID=2686091 RepID=UPI00157BD551|nr:UDP-4-amino-4,6-dideoxy-N-acetyl-beta-L-altrosamine N-acetyltransferase [Virgibacillus ihumii]